MTGTSATNTREILPSVQKARRYINSAASVAADDNYRFIYSLARIGDDLQDVFFIFPSNSFLSILPADISFFIKGVP